MGPIYLRITKENTNKENYIWKKSVYLFGIKMAQWEYYKNDDNTSLGFNKGRNE